MKLFKKMIKKLLKNQKQIVLYSFSQNSKLFLECSLLPLLSHSLLYINTILKDNIKLVLHTCIYYKNTMSNLLRVQFS